MLAENITWKSFLLQIIEFRIITEKILVIDDFCNCRMHDLNNFEVPESANADTEEKIRGKNNYCEKIYHWKLKNYIKFHFQFENKTVFNHKLSSSTGLFDPIYSKAIETYVRHVKHGGAYLDEPCLSRSDKDILIYWRLYIKGFPTWHNWPVNIWHCKLHLHL